MGTPCIKLYGKAWDSDDYRPRDLQLFTFIRSFYPDIILILRIPCGFPMVSQGGKFSMIFTHTQWEAMQLSEQKYKEKIQGKGDSRKPEHFHSREMERCIGQTISSRAKTERKTGGRGG